MFSSPPTQRPVRVLVRPKTFTLLPVWTVVAGLSIATAGFAAWSALGASDASVPTSRTTPRHPADARQEAILRAAIDKPGDRRLGEMYSSINVRHFAGALPAIRVVWEPRLEEVGHLAGRAFTLEGMFGRLGNRTIILLHPKLEADAAALARALCHEMVHAYLFTIGDSGSDHGAAFQRTLKRLADEGAFVGIVATDEERDALRAWLDGESTRLESERQQIERMAAELEQERRDVERAFAGLPADQRTLDRIVASRDAYNGRAAEASQRAQRHRDAGTAFQRAQDRYNLMVVYPDGVLRH
jgi:hypothetical protein